MTRFLFSVFAFAALTCQIALADLVVTIGNFDSDNRTSTPSFIAGSVVTLGLYIHNDLLNSSLNAQTFGLGIDLSLPGSANFYDGHNSTQLNSIFSNFTISSVAAGDAFITDPNNVASSADPALGFDVFVDFTATAPIPFAPNGNQSTAIHIANVSFKTSANMPIGMYGFKFNPNASFPDGSPANGVSSNLALAAGLDGSSFNRFSMSAVPEPSSLALGASVMCVLGSIRRFRRKDSKDEIAV